MCWASDEHPISCMADKDITCYKVFHKRDIIWGVEKTLDLTFEAKIKELKSLYRQYKYIPYNINPKIIINFKKFHTSPSFWSITEGYHSYNTLFKATLERIGISYLMVKCIIPIGSTYYLNNEDEIVSSDIIITDEIIN